MLDSVLEVFGVTPDWDLDIMTPRQTLSSITSKCLLGMDEAVDKLPDGGFQRVDNRVSGDKDVLDLPALPQEVFPVSGGRAKMQVRDGGGQHPVHLLRKGGGRPGFI